MSRRPHPARSYLESLRPALPTAMWVVIAAQLLSSIGTGFVLPFGTIYLHFVRGIPIPIVGTIISSIAVGGLVVTLVGGALIDRVGARRLVLAGAAFQAAGFVVFAAASTVPLAFAAALLVGIGNGVFFPAMTTVVANLTTSAERTGAASLQYVAINIGIGAGSVLGGLVVSVQHPATFVAIYLANAASFAAFAILIGIWVPADLASGLGPRARPEPAPAIPAGSRRGGYRAVLRDRTFLGVVGFNVLVVTIGYAQLDSAMPLYAKTYLGVEPAALGAILAANTALIVIAQLPVTRAIRGWRRTRALAALGAAWALAWGVGLAASTTRGAAAALMLAGFAVVFGLGECLLSSVIAPLAMDLSPRADRGAHMASLSLSWALGLLIGPTLGSLIVGSAVHQALWPVMAAGSIGLAAWALGLEPHLPAAANRPRAGAG